jgi:capsular exopolysaccharide synthesis family protein
MELKQYLSLLRRWAWLLGLGVILGALIGYIASLYQVPVYEASTRILVTHAPQDKTSDMTYLTDQQLTQTYVQLLTTQPVLDAVSLQLVYTVDPHRINVKPIANTQIIQLSFEDNDPARAAAVANTLVKVLIDQNENLQAGRYATTEESLQAQIKQIQDQIDSLQAQIDNASTQAVQDQLTQVQSQIASLQAEISSLQQDIEDHSLVPSSATPAPEDATKIAEDQARLTQIQPILSLYQQIYTNLVVLGKPMSSGNISDGTRLSQLQTTLGLYQQIYINLLNNLETVKLARLQNTPNVVQIEPASLPQAPIRPRPLLNTLLAGMVGLMLVTGIAFLIDYLDDTLKTPEDIERILDLSVIGYLAEIDYPVKGQKDICVIKQPRSPVSEAFRSLRTNLEFSGVDKPLRTILVTSAGPGEGKTTVSVNLAAIMAQGGKSVILLDTDMRRPQVHTFFNLTNQLGLSDLFRNNTSLKVLAHEFESLKDAAVITSGSPPPNPTELLGSDRMNQLLIDLKAAAEVVILDSPPSVVADAQILAAKVDGVILIVHPSRTHADAALASVEQMKRAGARILGVVLNRIPKNGAYYYGGYRYYYSPYYSTKTVESKKPAEPKESVEPTRPAVKRDPVTQPALTGFLNIFSAWRNRWSKNKMKSQYDWSYRTPATRAQMQSSYDARSKFNQAGRDRDKSRLSS